MRCIAFFFYSGLYSIISPKSQFNFSHILHKISVVTFFPFVILAIEEELIPVKSMSLFLFRFLILLVKTTQDVPKKVYQFVPILDLNKEWTDEKLYEKYKITEEEQAFIGTLVKPVNWNLQGGENE